MGKIYFYELCFYGDEDDKSKEYLKNQNKATSFCVKSDIQINSDDDVLALLKFGNKKYEAEVKENLTCWFEIAEFEAIEYFGYDKEIEDFVAEQNEMKNRFYNEK